MTALNGLKLTTKCSECNLGHKEIVCSFDNSNNRLFRGVTIANAYSKGALLFMQGEPSLGIYMLCQGSVKLTSFSKDGKAMILHIARPGEILGLSTAITNSVHIATAQVVEPSQVNFVRTRDFMRVLSQDAALCLAVAKQLSKNYQRAYLQVCSLGLSNSVFDRLAGLFLEWCSPFNEEVDKIRIRMKYTHEEIAEMIGSSRETVTRLFKDFRDRNLISRDGDELIIHDIERLREAASCRQ